MNHSLNCSTKPNRLLNWPERKPLSFVLRKRPVAQQHGRHLLFLGRRCCETLLPFSFKWQPHIATTFRARRSRPSGRNLSSKLNPYRAASAPLPHPPLASPSLVKFQQRYEKRHGNLLNLLCAMELCLRGAPNYRRDSSSQF